MTFSGLGFEVKHQSKSIMFCLLLFIFISETHCQSLNFEDSIISQRLFSISADMQLPWFPEVSNAVREKVHHTETPVLLSKFFNTETFSDISAERRIIPREFNVLPLIMSGMNELNSTLTNKAGLWGLDASAAVLFGLDIQPCYDERFDIMKSRIAAIDYLNFLYDEFNDWWLVLIAYTQSPATAEYYSSTDSTGSGGYAFITSNKALQENQFIIDFIYYNYLIHFYDEHNIRLPDAETGIPDEKVVELKLRKKVQHQDFFDKTGLDLQTFRSLNPTYLCGPLVPESMKYSIPDSALKLFQVWEDSLYYWFEHPVKLIVEPEQTNSSITYIVKKGDNLGAIASKHRVSVSNLKAWNHLKNDIIHPGQKLLIYNSRSTPAQKNSTVQNNSGNQNLTYTVKSGDSVWSIAQKYPGVEENDIRRLNNLKDNTIHPGQVLKLKETKE